MKKILVASTLMSAFLTTSVFAENNNSGTINYNLINLQAKATRVVKNDQIEATLFVEKRGKQANNLEKQVTQFMNQAMNTAKKYPQVKVTTGYQQTSLAYPYDENKRDEWVSTAQLNLESQDFTATSQLIADLRNNFQTRSIRFSVSPKQAGQVRNELFIEVTKTFQQQAQLMANAWNKSGYNLVNYELDTGGLNFIETAAPVMAVMKSADYQPPVAQNLQAGESEISVNATGTIQLK